MITDEEVDELRAVADRLRQAAEFTSYGYFCGGDPHDFTPDAEVCSAEELEQHAADCAAWEQGNEIDRGGPHSPLLDGEGKSIGHVTHAAYGMGVQSMNDPEILSLARDLDDVIDRIRQVAP